MRSMTGYGQSQRSNEDRELAVEIKSVNNRYLEISVTMPGFLGGLEAEIKRAIAAVAVRGKVDVYVRLREYRDAVRYRVDTGAVAAARAALREIGAVAGIEREPEYRDILQFDGIIQIEKERDAEMYRTDLFAVLEEARSQWDDSRRTEGDATARDIREHLGRVATAAAVFADAAPETERLIHEAVAARFRDVLGDEAEEQRVYAEAAMLMVRHATNEEVARLRSHIESFTTVMAEEGSVGKRLDFICQEMNREVNTTGSKTVLASVQDAVVEAKDAIEALREQIRNVE